MDNLTDIYLEISVDIYGQHNGYTRYEQITLWISKQRSYTEEGRVYGEREDASVLPNPPAPQLLASLLRPSIPE